MAQQSKQIKVTKCKRPALTEAWVVLRGLPSVFDDEELKKIEVMANKRIKDLINVPGFSVVPKTNREEAPFWIGQKQWDGGHFLSRYGHKYLSVHFLKKDQQPLQYKTYSATLEPEVKKWTKLFSEDVFDSENSEKISSIAFGYINRFEFDAQDFDVSKYFDLTYAFGLGSVGDSLNGFSLSFGVFDKKRNMNVTIKVETEVLKPNGKLPIRVQVFAENLDIGNVCFHEEDKVLKEIQKVKEFAKEAFFNFAKPDTHKIMGVNE